MDVWKTNTHYVLYSILTVQLSILLGSVSLLERFNTLQHMLGFG